MNIYIVKEGDQLDMICFKAYKTLDKDVYSQFLMENESLLAKNKLEPGDVVFLPKIEINKKSDEVKYLWS